MSDKSDPIADLLTRIRNACGAKRPFFDIQHSNIKENIVKVLKEEGFISHYLFKEENKKGTMRVFLKYSQEREPAIGMVKRMSKPSCRMYVSQQQLPRVRGGMGIAIVSTSKGVMEGEKARKENLGGELLCLVW